MTKGTRRWALTGAAALAGAWSCARPTEKGAPAIGGPFRLIDQDGEPVDQSILRGKWSAVYFGYTFCPDVCPTTLAALGRAQMSLGARARGFQVVFVTVDPARDIPAQLKTYLASPAFPKGVVGLTGSSAQITAVARAYHVYYKPAGTGPGYSVDHTSVIYLMDPNGAFSRPLDPSMPPGQLAAQVREAMDKA